MKNGGLQESPAGVTNRCFLRSRHWRWKEIDQFKAAGSRVYVGLGEGKVVPLIGVPQGYRVKWKGGETRDVVAVLNERLASWRAEHSAMR